MCEKTEKCDGCACAERALETVFLILDPERLRRLLGAERFAALVIDTHQEIKRMVPYIHASLDAASWALLLPVQYVPTPPLIALASDGDEPQAREISCCLGLLVRPQTAA